MGSSRQGRSTIIRRARAGLTLAGILILAVTAQQASGQQPFRTGQLKSGRVDLDTNLLRARYGLSVAGQVAPGASAAAVLEALDTRTYGWDPSQLRLVSEGRTDGVRHLRFRQSIRGVPVLGREVAVAIDAAGRISFVLNGFDPSVTKQSADTIPVFDQAEASSTVQAEVPGGRVGPAFLAILPGSTPRLVWRFVAYPATEAAEWEILVDARTGQVASITDVTARRRKGETPHPREIAETVASAVMLSRSDATGLIFDPDPLATAGVFYGPPYQDEGDADIPELNAERKAVTLPEISLGGDGLYRLTGPYVDITGRTQTGVLVYEPPAEPTPDFSYTRAEGGFEAANVYFHLHQSQLYLQQLGFTDIQNRSLSVNPAGTTADNSGWQASARYLFFGTGGVDDGEDASVIWHEYGHAILEGGAPGLRSSREGQALHEGWSDYWASSYQRYLVDEGFTQRDDWRTLYRWDAGDGQIWDGRSVDRFGVYPEDTGCDTAGSCDIYADGLVWATVLMEIHDELGRTVSDRLNLLSHRYLASPVTFRDAGEALIQADIDYNGGAHLEPLARILAARGLADVSRFSPVITFDALPDTEILGSARQISIEVLAIGPAVREATLIAQIGAGAAEQTIPLSAVDSRYEADLQLPAEADSVWYWIQVVDENDGTVVLPAGAPEERFVFFAGPDLTPPVIEHSPISRASFPSWPAKIEARISDGLGVASVRVEYRLAGSDDRSGQFALSEGENGYSGLFDVPLVEITPGSTIDYRILATDASTSANQARDPETGWYTFAIEVDGLVLSIDPETGIQELQSSGSWRREAATQGTQTAATGSVVWGVSPGEPYPASVSLSSLKLPALNLDGLDKAYLRLWHWYDVEHDAGTAWDGGNIKLSVDSGQSWNVLEPIGGYEAVIGNTRGNPLAGEPSFGGFSYGWRLLTAAIPTAEDVRLRFDFGTDNGNQDTSQAYAGWYLDDITVVTSLPTDAGAPAFIREPDDRIIAAPDQFPTISISASDDIGIDRAMLRYELTGDAGTEAGSLRMRESAFERSVFVVALAPARQVQPGDVITYDIALTDYEGNETVAPVPAARVDILLVEDTNLLAQARPSGGWKRDSGNWVLIDDEGALILPTTRLLTGGRDYLLTLSHQYRLTAGGRASAEYSLDDGRTWSLLVPDGGYDQDGAWTGSQPVTRAETFDVSGWPGGSLMVRLVGVATEGITTAESWQVDSVTLTQTIAAEEIVLEGLPALHANFPDPFAVATNISFDIPEAAAVELAVYDVLGRRIAVLADGVYPRGTHTFSWDPSGLSGGLYLARFTTGGHIRTERMILAR